MNINQAFPSKYLRAADLNGGSVIVTISHVEMEEIGQGAEKERKPVVYFEGKTKGVVLNKTNATMIMDIAKSEDTDDWQGVSIKLIAAEVEYQGKLVNSLRVRRPEKAVAAKPAPKAKPVVDEHDVDIDENAIPF